MTKSPQPIDKVLLDGRPLIDSTGISRYTRTLIGGLPSSDPAREYALFGWRSQQHLAQGEREPLEFRSSVLPGRLLSELSKAGLDAPRFGLGRPTIFHGTSFDVPRLRGCKTIITCHDLAFLHVPDAYVSGISEDYTNGIRKALRFVDMFATDSQHSREDLITHFEIPPDRIRVIYPAVVDGNGRPLFLPSPGSRCPSGPPYFLSVGQLNKRKNLLRMIDAFALIANETEHHLLLVGPPGASDYGNELRRRAQTHGLSGRIRFLGLVDDDRLANLYDWCCALVFCSLYEGFGYPAAEASARGRPVIASNVSSIPEVVGAAGVLVDPLSTESIADAMRAVAYDSDLAATLSRAGPASASRFSDKAMFSSVLNLYDDLQSPIKHHR